MREVQRVQSADKREQQVLRVRRYPTFVILLQPLLNFENKLPEFQTAFTRCASTETINWLLSGLLMTEQTSSSFLEQRYLKYTVYWCYTGIYY